MLRPALRSASLGVGVSLALGLAACHGTAAPVEPTPVHTQPPPPPAAVVWTKLVGPVKVVEATGGDATIGPKVKAAMAPIVGKPLDRRELRKILTAVFVLPGVAAASAHATQLADGVQVTIDVTPEPALRTLVAHETGGQDLPLPAQLTSAIGMPVDPGLLDALGVQLRDVYLAKGYTDATVAWKQTDVAGGSGTAVDVVVEVTPGKASSITGVEFKGNARVKRAELVKALGEGFAPGSAWNIDTIERGMFQITSYYYDHGYIAVAIQAPKPTGGPGAAVYTIVEGDQYRVGKVELTGVAPADAKKYIGMIGVKSGDVFNRTAVSAGISKVTDALHAAGKPTATIAPATNVDGKKKTVDLSFAVTSQ